MAKKILGFQIDVVGTSENKQKIAELTQEIQKLADIKAKLDEKIKNGESLSKNQELQYGKTTAAIKFLQGEKNKLITTQTNELKSINAVDKSYNSLVAQNAKLSQQLRALADPLGKDKEEFERLSSVIKKNTESLKTMDEAMGRSFRNVGDYAGGILKASNEMGLFGNAGMKVQQAMKSMQEGLNVVKAGFGSLKGAIVSTGIGALVIALTGLFNWFTKTREGALLMERGLAIANATVTVIANKTIDFARNLFDFAKSLVNVGAIIKDALSGDWEKVGKDFDLIAGSWDKVKHSFDGTLDSIIDTAKKTDDLTIATQKLRDAERALDLERAKSISKIENLRMIADDTTKSYNDRIGAIKDAFGLENNLLDKNISLLQNKINHLKDQDKLKGAQAGAEEYLNELNQLQVDLENAKAESYRKQKEELTKINSLEKEKAAYLENLKKQYGEIIVSQERAANGNRELTQQEIDNAKSAADAIIAEEERKRDESEKIRKEQIEAEKNAQEDMLEIKQAFGRAFADSAARIGQEITDREKQQIQDRYDASVSRLDEQLKRGVISQAQYDKQLDILNKKKFEQEKKNALNSIAIQAAVGVIYNLATGNYSAAISIGLAAAAEAAIIESRKYAKGGLVQGSGSGTSDSINARLSNGEFVMNAKSTAAFAPILNAMNVAGGGRNSFANGGMVSPLTASSMSGSIINAQSQMNFDLLALRIVSGINDKKVYLKEADVTESQKKVSAIISSSKF